MTYQVSQRANVGGTIAQMDNGSTFMFDNGTDANGLLGTWDQNDQGGIVKIQTGS